jgi:hypothetical protein
MKTTNTTIKNLAAWIESLKQFAEGDHELLVSWFKDTKDKPFSIVGGWVKMLNLPEEFCCSKAQPEYVMCVKIAKNEGPYAYVDFDSLNMPTDSFGNVDDTCIPLEWDDSADAAAAFFLCEWERIMTEHGED